MTASCATGPTLVRDEPHGEPRGEQREHARDGPRTAPMFLRLDDESRVPRYRQIYVALRDAITSGLLAPGTRLPASRALADDLGVSRITVLGAYDDLAADGLIAGRAGAGTVVLRPVAPMDRSPSSIRSTVARQQPTPVRNTGPRIFTPGLGPIDLFPAAAWARLTARHWRTLSAALLCADRGPGHQPLRESLATHLLMTRGVPCSAKQIVVTTSAQHAISITVRVLVGERERIVVEDPTDSSHRAAFASLGERVVPVHVDDQGLDVQSARRIVSAARLIAVTPRSQGVLGTRMSAPRRRALLDWAAAMDAWIVESDEGAELRTERFGEPSLASERHPAARRVIHVGSFATTLFPSLRIGYAVVPMELADAFAEARDSLDGMPSGVEQAVLAAFIREGHLARYVRRASAAVAQRRRALVQLATQELRGVLRIDPATTVSHAVAWLSAGQCDVTVAEAASRRALGAVALSSVRVHATTEDRPALLLGYAPFDQEHTQRGLAQLGNALGECARRGVALR
jgi:GntR family transcriptional regulator / MocR family aminotransferase